MSWKADSQQSPEEGNSITERREDRHDDPGEKRRMVFRRLIESAITQGRTKRSWLRSLWRILFGPRGASLARRRQDSLPCHVVVRLSLSREPLPNRWLYAVCEEALREIWQVHSQATRGVWLEDRSQLLTASCPEQEMQDAEAEWPRYAIEDFRNLVRNADGIQDSIGDAPQLLFHAMEMEALLAQVEEKARATSRTYEARLAASLRDICRVHDPATFSKDQAKCLRGSVTALVEGWGRLTRDKLKYVRSRLLDQGLTWLPVTDKALADLENAHE